MNNKFIAEFDYDALWETMCALELRCEKTRGGLSDLSAERALNSVRKAVKRAKPEDTFWFDNYITEDK